MVIRKHGKKWQCLVRLKGISVTQSFWSKGEASRWGKQKEVEILNGTYLKDLKLTQMKKLKECCKKKKSKKKMKPFNVVMKRELHLF